MQLIRSFIAIPLPETLQQQIATLQQNLQQEIPELRTVKPQNLHLTLNFLGDLSQKKLADIGYFMQSVVDSLPPFSLHLHGLGTFPGRKRPRVLWLGIKRIEPLLTLQRNLSSGLVEFGYTEDGHSYRPHLTLGRFRQPPIDTDILQNWQDSIFGPFAVKSIILYTSQLTPQGAVHQPFTIASLMGR